MELSVIAKEVERSGDFETQNFSIKQSPEVFEILSTTLYSDPVRAVVREICCNAYDAHVLVGQETKPFTVHLPTMLDGQFWVRDYGPGLDDQSMKDLYTTYFGSNKTHSNSQIGGFGLGSKSPFSLTDSFTVVSIHEGMKRSYTAHKNEANEPCLSKLGEVATDEPSGIRVIVPITEDQVRSFTSAAQKVLKYFKTKPEVNIEIEKPQYSFSGETWHVSPNSYYSSTGQNTHMVVMGNVAYPLEETDIIPSSEVAENQDLQRFINSTLLTLEVPIGALKPAASREKLHINKEATKYLQKVVQKVKDEMLGVLQKQVDECASKWDAYLRTEEITQGLGYDLAQHIKKSLTYNSKPIHEAFEKVERKGCELRTFTPGKLLQTTGSITGTFGDFRAGQVRKYTRFLELDRDDQPYPLRLAMRLRYALTHDDKFFIDISDAHIIVVEGTKQQRKEFFDQLEGAPVKNLMDIPYVPPVRQPRIRSTSGDRKKQLPVTRLTRWMRVGMGAYRPEGEECEAEGGIFIQTLMGIPLDAKGEKCDKVHEHIEAFRLLGLIDKDTPIYVVPTSFIKITKSNKDWVNLYDFVKKGFLKFYKDLDPNKQARMRKIKTDLGYSYSEYCQLYSAIDDILPKSKRPRAIFRKYHKEYARLLELAGSMGVDYSSEINKLSELYDLPRKYTTGAYHHLEDLPEAKKFLEYLAYLKETHPLFCTMVKVFNHHQTKVFKDEIANHIMNKEL